MRKNFKNFVFGLMVLGLVIGSASLAAATSIPITSVDGDWANASGGNHVVISNDQAPNGRKSTASWGVPANLQFQKSSYEFLSTATPFDANSDGTVFSLGTFTHNNFAIFAGGGITSIDLLFDLGVAALPSFSGTFAFRHDETPNSPGPPSDNDLVTLTNPTLNQDFTYDGTVYYFSLLGFSQDGGSTIRTTFSTIENQANIANLYATITEVPISTPEPTTMLLLGLGLVGLAGASRKFKK